MRCLCTYHESLVPLPGLVWLLLVFSAEESHEKTARGARWEVPRRAGGWGTALNSLLKRHEKPLFPGKPLQVTRGPFFLMITVHIAVTVFFSSQYCLIAWWLLGMTLGLERWLPPMFSLCKCRKWKKWRDTNMYSIKYLWWHGWSKEILLRYRNLWKLWDMYISFQQFASWWFVTLSGAAGVLPGMPVAAGSMSRRPCGWARKAW